MDQNQANNQTVDNDLQKAIDDITNTTNVDPVFSDPVAAPSSVPEGDTGELGEPIGPFPEPKLEVVPPEPEPIAPLESMNNLPDLEAFSETGIPIPPVPPVPAMPEMPAAPGVPEETMPMVPTAPEVPDSSAAAASTPEQIPVEPVPQAPNTSEIKMAALRDLVTLLDKVTMDNSKKFNIYRSIINDLKDTSVLDAAYQTARGITDETERAEALLYLVDSIDNM